MSYMSNARMSPLMVHGDIGLRNITIDENDRLAALLDGGSFGWFPDYWEFAQFVKFCDPGA